MVPHVVLTEQDLPLPLLLINKPPGFPSAFRVLSRDQPVDLGDLRRAQPALLPGAPLGLRAHGCTAAARSGTTFLPASPSTICLDQRASRFSASAISST